MFSRLYEQALRLAMDSHGDQTRKGSSIPYVTHVVHVAHIVATHGFDEEVVAAALLHDVVEDTPVELDELEDKFNAKVASLVEWLTEDKTIRDMDERNRRTVETLRGAPADGKAIKAADVMHNMSTTIDDLSDGQEVWSRFKGGRDRKLAYYSDVLDALADGWDHPLLDRAREILDRLSRLP